jgi:hypothetical protein
MSRDEAYKMREIVTATQDADGPGWVIELNCGHTIWCAVQPSKLMYCGACLTELVERSRRMGGEKKA